ncbi:hypothetical protein [Cupriavidus metallidurans]|uniref:hypothetical protein n=1 Tax=Cupriavidus metallidurans TaxID=119219 RepID=UPI000CE027B1|nr:hypothetical protein [Cupriavidus metallidurans]AVA32824.1 hypothetical protein C3Z06_03835 [Cupriavidus metallidurans]
MSWLLRQVEGFVLAVLLAVLLSVPTVRAQTLNSDGSLHWGITSSGPSTSQVVGTSLVIAAVASGLVLTLTPPGAIAGAGAATVALTGRAFTLAGQYVGPIAAGMLRQAIAKGPLTGAMLALAVALGSDAAYDPGSNQFLSAQSDAGDPSGGTKYWSGSYNNNRCQAAGTNCGWQQALDAVWANYKANNGGAAATFVSWSTTSVNGSIAWVRLTWRQNGNAPVTQDFTLNSYGTRTVGTAPSTDAQLGSAASAPSALAKVWDAGGCPQKVTTFRDTLSADDPCAKIISDPRGQWTPVTVPNGGSISLPSTTQTVTDSTGKVAQTITTTPTAQVKPNTDQATMAASPVIVTPGSVVKTVTNNADGSQTTTTTTTTSPSTSTDQPQDGTAAFNAGTQDLYTKKSRTWAQVLGDFQTAVKAAPWYQAATGFFNVSISGGACPHWTVPASKWTPALDAGVYVCSSSMITLYQAGGIIVMIVAAWAAFRIAFL